MRFTVDRRDEDGQFILTGSATPVDDNEKHHSGTGRIARIVMRPMTLSESGESSKQVSRIWRKQFSNRRFGIFMLQRRVAKGLSG